MNSELSIEQNWSSKIHDDISARSRDDGTGSPPERTRAELLREEFTKYAVEAALIAREQATVLYSYMTSYIWHTPLFFYATALMWATLQQLAPSTFYVNSI